MIWSQARPLPSLGPSWATQTTPEISNKYEIMILMILTRAPQTRLNITILLHPQLDLEQDFGYIYSLDLFSAKRWMLTRFYKIFAVEKNVRHSLNFERKNHFTMLYNVLIRILSNATVVFVDALPKIGSRKIWSSFDISTLFPTVNWLFLLWPWWNMQLASQNLVKTLWPS